MRNKHKALRTPKSFHSSKHLAGYFKSWIPHCPTIRNYCMYIFHAPKKCTNVPIADLSSFHLYTTIHLALLCGYFEDSLQSTHIVPARLYPYEQILHHVILKEVLAPLVLNRTHNTCILHP
jgi:hypothetical protein